MLKTEPVQGLEAAARLEVLRQRVLQRKGGCIRNWARGQVGKAEVYTGEEGKGEN